jgi:hypothetical protein
MCPQRVVADAVGVQAGELDVRHVVEAQHQPAVVPGVALVPRGLVHPLRQDVPVGEGLSRRDHRQAGMVDGGPVHVGRAPLADLPADAAEELRVLRGHRRRGKVLPGRHPQVGGTDL